MKATNATDVHDEDRQAAAQAGRGEPADERVEQVDEAGGRR